VAYAAGGVVAFFGVVLPQILAWWRGRKARQAAADRDAWKRQAEGEKARADGAEATADAIRTGAVERQTELEEGIRRDDQERIDHPGSGDGAQRRVRGRWLGTDPAGGADVPARDPAAVPGGAAGGPGAGPAPDASLRGRR
jgi:hypothetical protein